jgi:hypothetical protein
LNNEEHYLSEVIDVIDEILSSGGEFRLFPKGTSMLPLLVQGVDSVVLKRREGTPVQKHEIAFYRRDNGQFVLHRVMKIRKDGTHIMCGDNQYKLEFGIRPDQILGYVSEIYKGDKPLGLHSLRYRIYVFFWTFMPYRRVIRFPKRVASAIKRKLLGNK